MSTNNSTLFSRPEILVFRAEFISRTFFCFPVSLIELSISESDDFCGREGEPRVKFVTQEPFANTTSSE